MKNLNILKALSTISLAVYGIVIAQDPSDHGFLDRVDLVAHEAGHMLFS